MPILIYLTLEEICTQNRCFLSTFRLYRLLDGRVFRNSQKGINIIQLNNGTTKKVLIK